MSFMKRAQEAAAEIAARANQTANDPATQEQISRSAREALGVARRGMTTVVEKIDPTTLAELIVRATALQEMTNRALRERSSPYRIAEISISASIPPSVSFSIGRIGDDVEEVVGRLHSSAELVQQADAAELVLALDGTTVDESAVPAAGGGRRRRRDAAELDLGRLGTPRRRLPGPRSPRPGAARPPRSDESPVRRWRAP